MEYDLSNELLQASSRIIEDTKGVIRMSKSKKETRDDQEKMYWTNNNQPNTTQKTNGATLTPIKTRVNLGAPEG